MLKKNCDFDFTRNSRKNINYFVLIIINIKVIVKEIFC